MADETCESGRPVPLQINRDSGWSHASVVHGSGVENENTAALHTRIQELQAQKEDLHARRAGYQKLHLDTLVDLCLLKKNRSAFEEKGKEMTRKLAKVRAAHENNVYDQQTMESI